MQDKTVINDYIENDPLSEENHQNKTKSFCIVIKRTINKQQKIKHGEAPSIFHVLIRNQTILQIAFTVRIILLESI